MSTKEQKRKHAAYMRKWRRDNPDKTEKYKEKVKLNLRKWRKENPEKARAIVNNYRRNNPEKTKEWDKKYRVKYPEKMKAHSLVRSRKIPLKKSCEECESTERLEHHHPDYSKPLITETLCKPCHTNYHYGEGV